MESDQHQCRVIHRLPLTAANEADYHAAGFDGNPVLLPDGNHRLYAHLIGGYEGDAGECCCYRTRRREESKSNETLSAVAEIAGQQTSKTIYSRRKRTQKKAGICDWRPSFGAEPKKIIANLSTRRFHSVGWQAAGMLCGRADDACRNISRLCERRLEREATNASNDWDASSGNETAPEHSG